MIGRTDVGAMIFIIVCGNPCFAGIVTVAEVNLIGTTDQKVLSSPDTSISSSSSGGGSDSFAYATTGSELSTSAMSTGAGLIYGADSTATFSESFNVIGAIPGLELPLQFIFTATEATSAASGLDGVAVALSDYHFEVSGITDVSSVAQKLVQSQFGVTTASQTGTFGTHVLDVSINGSGVLYVETQSSASSSPDAISNSDVHLTLTSVTLPSIFAYEHSLGGVEIQFESGGMMPVTFVNAVPEPSSFALFGLGGIGLAIAAFRRRMTNVVTKV